MKDFLIQWGIIGVFAIIFALGKEMFKDLHLIHWDIFWPFFGRTIVLTVIIDCV